MEQLKFCKDCRHYQQASVMTSHRCRHERNSHTDLVTGASVYERDPRDLRADVGVCGRQAEWFSPAQTSKG